MKNSWHSATGPTERSNAVYLERAIGILLSPFYILMLAGSQVADLSRFGVTRLAELTEKLYYQVSVGIDRLPYSFDVKYRLMIAAAWAPTVVLALVLGWLGASLIQDNIDKSRQKAAIADTLESYITESKIVNVEWPADLVESTTEARIRLTEDELIELTASFNELKDEDLEELSQAEKINLALVYYYFGNEMQYKRFLEEARMMDPNDRVFSK